MARDKRQESSVGPVVDMLGVVQLPSGEWAAVSSRVQLDSCAVRQTSQHRALAYNWMTSEVEARRGGRE